VVGAAVGTERRLCDAASLYLHRTGVLTHMALEERFPHLWDDSRRPDHHPTHRDQLVNILGIQVSHAGHLFHAKWTNLHNISFSYRTFLYLAA